MTSPAEQPAAAPVRHDPYAALREPSVRLYLGGNMIASMGYLMKDTAVSWEVYARTGSLTLLGAVGLVQATPVLMLPLLTGHVADRFDRKKIMAISLVALALVASVLAINALWIGSVPLIFACLFVHGIVRAFQQPARQSLLPQIARPESFANAMTWGTGGFQMAQMLGPIIAAELLFRLNNASLVYAIYAALNLVFLAMLWRVEHRAHLKPETVKAESVLEGVRFLFRNRLLLTVMSIDLFAVILGGATGLLPAFQEDVLNLPVRYLGWMRAAPAMGSVVVSVWIAHHPPFRMAGPAMLLAVAGYAITMILYGLSTNFWLSMAALVASGGCDIVSVVIRHTLVQTLTPDSMRGRVSALNGMFIGASNYLGDAEAGYVAAWGRSITGSRALGAQISVVLGGIGSLAVAGVAAAISPQLRRVREIGGVRREEEKE